MNIHYQEIHKTFFTCPKVGTQTCPLHGYHPLSFSPRKISVTIVHYKKIMNVHPQKLPSTLFISQFLSQKKLSLIFTTKKLIKQIFTQSRPQTFHPQFLPCIIFTSIFFTPYHFYHLIFLSLDYFSLHRFLIYLF